MDVVSDLVDPADGKTSLREAVALFNTAPDDFGNNSISFADTLNGKTITLTAGELEVTGKTGATNTLLTLQSTFSATGPVRISGGDASRLFSVAAGIELTVNEFVLTGGKDAKGGAILNAGTLSLFGTTLDGNTATGADGGGAIYIAATGKLSVAGATVSNNTAAAGNGGRVLDFGGAGFDVVNSPFAGNKAAGDGGAVIAGNLSTANPIGSGNAADGDGGGV